MARQFLQLALGLALLGWNIGSAHAQTPTPSPTPSATSQAVPEQPFTPAERLTYEANVSRLLLRGVTVAQLVFTAQKQANSLTFQADIDPRGFFIKLFGVEFDYKIRSESDPVTLAARQTTISDTQGKRRRESLAVFDAANRRVTWTETDPTDKKRPPRTVISPLPEPVPDALGGLYLLRLRPLRAGDNFTVPMSLYGQTYQIPVRVGEKVRLSTALGKFRVWPLEVQAFGEGRLVEGEGEVMVWVTDDARRLPVRARVRTEDGTLDIKLKKYEKGGAVGRALR